jgi:single-stranded-DNA-specific exonuclease
MRKYVEEALEEGQTRRLLRADTILDADEVSLDTLEEIARLAPFGTDNPNPMFLIKDLRLLNRRAVGFNHRHLQMRFSKNGSYLEAIGFGLGHLASEFSPGSQVDVMALLSENNWRNERKVQLMIKDIRPAGIAEIIEQDRMVNSL